MTFETYYSSQFEHWVNYLSKLIGSREEAEDRVQDVFMYLSKRKNFCEELIEREEFGSYVHGAVTKQVAQMCREKSRRVPIVNLEDMDLLSWVAGTQQDSKVAEQPELDDFYVEALKRLECGYKSLAESFDTMGELRQYILIQYTRNSRTFKEIGELVGVSYQFIEQQHQKIKEILAPLIIDFIGEFT